ncbi:hypothetical protein MaMVDC_30 [uncultured phage]|nr:hypothetical protein MaMVDC_30 [uncultured phage]
MDIQQMDIRRAMLVRKQYDRLPIEAKQYVDALVLEVKQNHKLDYLELFYKSAIKGNIMDCLLLDNYDWNQSIARKITFWVWLFLAFCKTDVFIPKQLKTDANLFMLSMAVASNFVVEGDYKEIYGTYHSWPYKPNTSKE